MTLQQETIFKWVVQSPIGEIKLFATEKHLVGLYLEKEKIGPLHRYFKEVELKKVRVHTLAARELALYFKGELKQFSVPVRLCGTDFQVSVWKGLNKIKLGKVSTYSAHAKLIGAPQATRAVSTAIGSNPISIMIPCHRVIGKSGKLTGYAGGLAAKAWLLRHEGLDF